MRRFEAIHAVVALLLASSITSCQNKTRYVKTVPSERVQARVAECVQTTGQKVCKKLCSEVFGYEVENCTVDKDGAQTDVWYEVDTPDQSDAAPESQCAGGRRPAGLACAPRIATVAAYFAWSAQMEAASVTAFARVHHHLVELGGNEDLLARVRAAIGDEIEHAYAMVALARRYGVQPTAPEIADVELTLVERALENAVEGCVNETVAAIHAALIATHAADPIVRDTFAKIAVDETEHALLSYDLAAEYARHLDASERAQVVAAFVRAAAAPGLRSVTGPLAALGVPDDGSLATTVDRVLAAIAPRMLA